MKYRLKGLKSVVLLIVVIAAAMLLMNFFGFGTQRSATRVGYTSSSGWRSWSASYTLLDGWLEHTIHPETEPCTLHVEVVTESGAISIEMKDADGNVVFSESNMGTSSFDVEVPGNVVVHVEADNHKGSFDIRSKT